MLTKDRRLCFSLTAGAGDHLMQAQWGELCKEHQEPWYFSFLPTLGRANVQNADFINLTSSTKRFHPTRVPAWIPPVRISLRLQLQLLAVRTDLSAPLGKGGKSSPGWSDKCLSFKPNVVLPCALFQFPSVSFAKALLPWNSQKFGFFFF